MSRSRTIITALLGALVTGTCIQSGSAFSLPSNRKMSFMPTSKTAFSSTSLEAFKFGSSSAIEEVEPPPEENYDKLLDPVADLCILGLRLGTSALMIHHGLDKIQNVDGFSANVVAKFFGFLPGNPSFWTLSAAATQVAGSALLAIGIFSRPVAASMMATMLAAVVFHLLNTGPEGFPLAVVAAHSYNFELAAMYVGVLGYFSAAGAGAYSVDEKVLGGELKLYGSLLGGILKKD